MEALLLLPLSILAGAHCQDWGVTLPTGPLAGPIGSSMTIPCSYTYPEGQRVRDVVWSRGEERIVHLVEELGPGHATAKRIQFLGDLKDNCSLRFNKLEPGDGGAYYFEFQTQRQRWRSPRALCLTVSGTPCRVHHAIGSSGAGALSGSSFFCKSEHCASGLYWTNSSGVRIPEQSVTSKHESQLHMHIVWQHRGAALECRVKGYRDRSIPKGSQPPAMGRPPLLKVLVDADGPIPIREGDSFTLRCVGHSGLPDQTYYWVHDDDNLYGGPSVRVERATSSDVGNYTCMLWVSGPGRGYLTVSPTTYVAILAPPLVHVVASPGPHRSAGDPLSLTCRLNTSSYAEVGFSWYKDDERLGWAQPELAFPGVRVEDAGKYHCEVHNALGKSASLPLSITVVYGSDWYQLSPGPLAGVGTGVLLLFFLSNLGVYCLARRTHPGDEPGGTLQGGSRADPSAPQGDSLYEEIPCAAGDIPHPSDEDRDYYNSPTGDYCN